MKINQIIAVSMIMAAIFFLNVVGETISLKTLKWDERKPFCGTKITDMMMQVCRNHFYVREPTRSKRSAKTISEECCTPDGCTPLEMRLYCSEEEQRTPRNFVLYYNIPRSLISHFIHSQMIKGKK